MKTVTYLMIIAAIFAVSWLTMTIGWGVSPQNIPAIISGWFVSTVLGIVSNLLGKE